MLAAHLNQGQAPATLVRTYIMINVRLGDYVMQRETTSHWTEEDLDRKVIVCTHNLTLKQANSVCRSVSLTSSRTVYRSTSHFAGLVVEDTRRRSVEFGAIFDTQNVHYNRFWINYVQQQRRGFSALHWWLCRLKLGLHLIPLMWSHGKADGDKMEISLQQLAAVMRWSEEKHKIRRFNESWWVERRGQHGFSVLQQELEVRI